jgi:Aspartyl/Asparaginyl beta-hydroxylase
MFSSLKLPFSFDPESLQSDLNQIKSDEWVTHFNQDYFEGEWTGVALRSVGGLTNHLYPDPRATEESYADTPIIERCPNVRAALAFWECPVRSVRFLRLAAGSSIREHRDYELKIKDGQARFHVPIVTNADVVFFLDAQRITMNEGECWYLDLSLPHWVENRGAIDRIHLVVDCEVNDWLRELLATAERAYLETQTAPTPVSEECPSSPMELERFRQAVFTDLKLQQELRVTWDPESFARLVVSLGRARGYRFTLSDVEHAYLSAKRAWIERWVN